MRVYLSLTVEAHSCRPHLLCDLRRRKNRVVCLEASCGNAYDEIHSNIGLLIIWLLCYEQDSCVLDSM